MCLAVIGVMASAEVTRTENASSLEKLLATMQMLLALDLNVLSAPSFSLDLGAVSPHYVFCAAKWLFGLPYENNRNNIVNNTS